MTMFNLLHRQRDLRDQYRDKLDAIIQHYGCPSERMPVLAEMVIIQHDFRDVCDQLTPYKN